MVSRRTVPKVRRPREPDRRLARIERPVRKEKCMSDNRKFGSPIDRRSMLRGTAGAGLALPFAVPALARAQDHEHDSPSIEGTPSSGYVGSDPTSSGTGTTAPVATKIVPFERYDPFLGPVEPGPKTINLFAGDRTLYVADEVPYAAWTFDGSVPGNMLRARVGDEITFNFHVQETANAAHSVDFHSAEGDPEENYKTINPGERFSWTFTPRYPGAFMYHCG